MHTVHEIDPHTDQKQEGQQAQKKRLEAGSLLRLGCQRNVILDQKVRHSGVLGLDRCINFVVRANKAHVLPINRRLLHSSVLHRLHKLRIGASRARLRRVGPAEEIEQHKDHNKEDDPKSDVSCIAQEKLSQMRWRMCFVVLQTKIEINATSSTAEAD